MDAKRATPDSIDAYIGEFPANVRVLLLQLRATISSAAPTAIETISYGIPTYDLNGKLVHFAARSLSTNRSRFRSLVPS